MGSLQHIAKNLQMMKSIEWVNLNMNQIEWSPDNLKVLKRLKEHHMMGDKLVKVLSSEI